jgi:hypothetical protein
MNVGRAVIPLYNIERVTGWFSGSLYEEKVIGSVFPTMTD